MLIWAAQQRFLPKLVQDQQLQTLIYVLTFRRIEDYLQQFLRHFYSNYVLHPPPPPIALLTDESENGPEGRSGAVSSP